MDNQIIVFSKNWNHKLDCNSFSTIRLENPSKYKLGEFYIIMLNEGSGKQSKNLGPAKLVAMHSFYLEYLTEAVAYLDTNMKREDCMSMIKTMYSKHKIDFATKKLSFLVFQYTNQK